MLPIFMPTPLKLLLLLFIFSSCDKTYKVYTDRAKGSEPIKDGFHLNKIIVTSIKKNGRPSDYSITQTLYCGPNHYFSRYYYDKVYSTTEKKLLNNA